MADAASSSPSDSNQADPYEAALEAASECLLELQLIGKTTRDDMALQQRVKQAIASLRFALAQVRLARERDRRGLGHGFTLATQPEAEQ